MPDGRLGLIDYGQVVRLDDHQRLQLARLVSALAARGSDGADGSDTEAVAAAAAAMGFRTKRMSAEALCRLAAFLFDGDEAPRGGRAVSPAAAMRSIDAQDPIVHIPSEYILAARVSLLMRGTAQLMAQERLQIARAWRAEAETAVRTLSARTS
eukprot:6600376-Prymnesium_polylepis.1